MTNGVLLLRTFVFPRTQSAEAGERDEYESEREAGRAAARRPPLRDDGRPLRHPHAAAGAHQVGGVMPVGGLRGEARHGRHQARTRHRAAGEGGDRGAARVRRSTRGAHPPTEATTSRAGQCCFQSK